MHELSLCEAIADTVHRYADGARVSRIEVRIGHLRGVVPDSLLFSWEILTQGTDLEGSELAIDHVPAVVRCRACTAETRLDMPIMLCGQCESADVTVVSGEEFLIAAIDRAAELT
jgi:hydrogenase nickel incorporation protein HypA/HybF